jgi:hypothetical protein
LIHADGADMRRIPLHRPFCREYRGGYAERAGLAELAPLPKGFGGESQARLALDFPFRMVFSYKLSKVWRRWSFARGRVRALMAKGLPK